MQENLQFKVSTNPLNESISTAPMSTRPLCTTATTTNVMAGNAVEFIVEEHPYWLSDAYAKAGATLQL